MRKVFFSFHYQNDYWRVQNVMNSQQFESEYEKSKFLTAQNWEEIKRGGDNNIKRWIREQMKGASVACVLIGSKTAYRRWVKFEMQEAEDDGKGLLGIYIHGMKDQNGEKDNKGSNPLSGSYLCYNWVDDDGRNNIGDWIEKAAQQAGR